MDYTNTPKYIMNYILKKQIILLILTIIVIVIMSALILSGKMERHEWLLILYFIVFPMNLYQTIDSANIYSETKLYRYVSHTKLMAVAKLRKMMWDGTSHMTVEMAKKIRDVVEATEWVFVLDDGTLVDIYGNVITYGTYYGSYRWYI